MSGIELAPVESRPVGKTKVKFELAPVNGRPLCKDHGLPMFLEKETKDETLWTCPDERPHRCSFVEAEGGSFVW